MSEDARSKKRQLSDVGEASTHPNPGAFRSYEAEPEDDDQPRSKRAQIAAACNTCRRRKTKCSGERPRCAYCEKYDRECVYETDQPAETHGRALRRRYNDLRASNASFAAENSSYAELFALLQTADDDKAKAALNLIRTGAHVDTVLNFFKGADLLQQLSLIPETRYRYDFPWDGTMPPYILTHPNNPFLSSRIYEGTLKALPGNRLALTTSHPIAATAVLSGNSVYHVPHHAGTVVDPRLEQVTAQPWTSVTTDDRLVRELLTAYFYLVHPFHPVLHKDIFLDDMISGRPRYCSSLLVNACLAAACHCLPKLSKRAHFWDPDTLIYRFLAEFRRLWELEREKAPVLTTVQAAAVSSITASVNAMDKVGRSYWVQATAMAYEIDLFSPEPVTSSIKRRSARAVTGWGLFIMQSLLCFMFNRPSLILAPPADPLPSYDDMSSFYGDLYLKFHNLQTPIPHYLGQDLKAQGELHTIINDINIWTFASKEKGALDFDEALAFRDRLEEWAAALPSPLKAQRVYFPCHLKIHMNRYNVLISLFTPFVGGPGNADNPQNEREDSPARSQALTIIADAMILLETVVRFYYLRHGYEYHDPMLIHFISLLAFSSLAEIATSPAGGIRAQASLSTLILCAQGLQDLGRNGFVAEVVFRVVRARMQPEHVKLLRQESRYENEQVQEAHLAGQVQSTWPVGIVGVDHHALSSELGELVKELTDVSLNERHDSESPSV